MLEPGRWSAMGNVGRWCICCLPELPLEMSMAGGWTQRESRVAPGRTVWCKRLSGRAAFRTERCCTWTNRGAFRMHSTTPTSSCRHKPTSRRLANASESVPRQLPMRSTFLFGSRNWKSFALVSEIPNRLSYANLMDEKFRLHLRIKLTSRRCFSTCDGANPQPRKIVKKELKVPSPRVGLNFLTKSCRIAASMMGIPVLPSFHLATSSSFGVDQGMFKQIGLPFILA